MHHAFAGKVYYHGHRASPEDARRLAECMPMVHGARTVTEVCGPAVIAAGPVQSVRAEVSPLIYTEPGQSLFVGSGSVYNRDEIEAELSCGAAVCDRELLWRAFQKWGTAAADRLEGDWMFAAYEQRDDRITLARSWGHSSLYVYRAQDFVGFATHPAALTSLREIHAAPDLSVVAQILNGSPLHPALSCWEGVNQVMPGACLTFTRGVGTVRQTFSPQEVPVRQIEKMNEPVVYEQFTALFNRAVQKRLPAGQEAGATLSAGLDSTAVCCLAARELARRNRKLRLWTAVPYFTDEAYTPENWLSDERELAELTAGSFPNADHSLLDASDASPIEAIRTQILQTGRALASGANHYWISRLLETAAAAGCETLLTGQFGNASVSWSPPEVALFPKDRFYPGITWEAYAGLIRRRRQRQINGSRRGMPPNTTPNMLVHPEFKNSRLFQQSIERPPFADFTGQGRAETHSNLFDLWYHSGFWHGITVRDPTMDNRLVAFLQSLPASFFYRDGIDRRMVRVGMRGLMPDAARRNIRRGLQGADIIPRIRSFGHHADAAITRIRASALASSVLNIECMEQVLADVLRGESGPDMMRRCFTLLIPGLSVGLFLAPFDTDWAWRESLDL